ncbi:MAG: type VI secretion system protein TssA [Advenella sp.]|nr:type VI secretion system protein TssA [Advenella sp.]
MKQPFIDLFSQNQCGCNLEYDADFLDLQQSVIEKPEQQFGSTIIQAQAPDWHQVEKKAAGLCARTCDLRVLGALTWAWTMHKGIVGYAAGIGLVEHVLQQFWPDVYPLLVDDGYEDPLPRVNALVALADMQGVAKDLRSCLLLSGAHGQITLRDAESVLDGSKPDLYPGGRVRLQEVLNQALQNETAEVMALINARNSLQNLREMVSRHLGNEWAPDFSALLRSLGHITQAMEEVAAHHAGNEAGAHDGQGQAEQAPAIREPEPEPTERPVSWKQVQIRTREDAMLALEKVSSYFEVNEPSHPAPFLLRRVQQTIPMNFHEILKNLIPVSAEQFEAWMPKDD